MQVDFPLSAEEGRRARHSGMLNPNLKKIAILLERHGIPEYTMEKLRICDGSLPDEFIDTFINFLEDAEAAAAERKTELAAAHQDLYKATEELEKEQDRSARNAQLLSMLQQKGDALYEHQRERLRVEGEQVREMNLRELDLARQIQREEFKMKLKQKELDRLSDEKHRR
ncbi:Hypothetical protein, putative [Bodo saltans]|uniref:Uncharacterized protein n=1 Tax=Bodo saltans TaxID=75058 RepID=A0A0S4J150_BODSA|nr:Hypothetical protein, putative [Bodo saltans]|eukprot:CUG52348.1 Hypothetical protein, putative [Bodo saltans]